MSPSKITNESGDCYLNKTKLTEPCNKIELEIVDMCVKSGKKAVIFNFRSRVGCANRGIRRDTFLNGELIESS